MECQTVFIIGCIMQPTYGTAVGIIISKRPVLWWGAGVGGDSAVMTLMKANYLPPSFLPLPSRQRMALRRLPAGPLSPSLRL